jgi:hypothetical protein
MPVPDIRSENMYKATSILLALGLASAAYLLPGDPIARAEEILMSKEIPSSNVIGTGFSYSPELAAKFGLPEDDAILLKAPLLGAAIEIKNGIVGKICLLHILYDAKINIRLPAAQAMQALGSNMDVFPNGFLESPDKEIRKFFADQVGALANRAMFRYGKSELDGEVVSGEDTDGSYTSLPLNGYNREFVPGVGWLAMSINCELAAHEEYRYATLYLESNDSPEDMILNGYVNPSRLIEFQIPQVLMRGMRSSLRAAAEESSEGLRSDRFSVIK